MDANFQCRATARLLRTGQMLSLAGHVGAVIAGFRIGSGLSTSALICWLAMIYFSIRVQLDAELLDLLAEDPQQLDTFLAEAGLKKRADSRSIEDRCQGAVKLWKCLVLALILELALLMANYIK